jgi:hypothetical protein
MVKDRAGQNLKVVGCSIQTGVEVFDKVSSPMCLDRDEGGRACPSAVEEWICAVLDAWEQCIGLPGDLETDHAATPTILSGPRMLCPEAASVLAASRRAGGLDDGKTTPSSR